MAVTRHVVIDPRFRGPKKSANGGYACGVLAEKSQGVVSARLFAPPPLGTPMSLTYDGQAVSMIAGDRLIGDARSATLDLDVPQPPSLVQAMSAVSRYAGFHGHPFPECFVCGPDRPPGDGLRLFPGRIPKSGLVATPWVPDGSVADQTGSVAKRVVWAALDCPSYFAILSEPPALLASLTAEVTRRPEIGEQVVAIGWHVRSKGRKHWCGSAVVAAEGDLLARAASLWIEPKDGLPV
jgi:hypothetical protein